MHTTPEQRYQERKETYYFHKLYRDNGEYGCNPTQRPEICVPECRYHGETGRFEDSELIEEYKEAVALYEKYKQVYNEIQNDNLFTIASEPSNVLEYINEALREISKIDLNLLRKSKDKASAKDLR